MVNNMKKIIFITISIFILFSCTENRIKESYYESGELHERFVFLTKEDFESNLNYEAYCYHIDGSMKKQSKVLNGHIEGAYIEYYDDGAVKKVSQFKSGKKYGIERILSPQGEVVIKNFFINGIQMTQMKSFNTSDGSADFFYYTEEDTIEECGRLVYDSKDSIIKNESFYYKFSKLDTLELGEKYDLDIEVYTFGENNVIKEFILGEFDSYYDFVNKESLMKISSNDNKISFSYTPVREGYNMIMGKLYVESEIEIDSEVSKVSREMIIYEDFFVQNTPPLSRLGYVN